MICKCVSAGKTRMTWVCFSCDSISNMGAPTNLDAAIWDNRSVYHAATWDYEGLGPRTGHRAVGLGERPFFDPKSKSRREALGESE